jgi:hypothetical protein
MHLVDLTRTLDSNDYARLPEKVKRSASALVPRIEYYAPDGKGAQVMCELFGCEREQG